MENVYCLLIDIVNVLLDFLLGGVVFFLSHCHCIPVWRGFTNEFLGCQCGQDQFKTVLVDDDVVSFFFAFSVATMRCYFRFNDFVFRKRHTEIPVSQPDPFDSCYMELPPSEFPFSYNSCKVVEAETNRDCILNHHRGNTDASFFSFFLFCLQ